MAVAGQMKFIFDRKKRSTNIKPGVIEIEVKFDGSRKWISTGIKVLSQWKKDEIVKHPEAVVLNNESQKIYNALHTRLQIMVSNGVVDLDELLKEKTELLKQQGSFLDYMKEKIGLLYCFVLPGLL